MEFKKIITDKDQWIKLGKGSLKLGKVIIVKGTQAVVANGVAKVLTTSFDGGLDGVKKLGFDEVIGVKKPKTPGLFSKKKDETEEVLEEVAEVTNTDEESIKIDDADVEIIDKK